MFPDPVPVALPKGLRPGIRAGDAGPCPGPGTDFACAGIVKDAGDDPDVTHGALIVATVRFAPQGRAASAFGPATASAR